MPTINLRPSAEAFRRAGWLPLSQEVYDNYMKELAKQMISPAKKMPGPGTLYDSVGTAPELIEPIKEFKDFIETNAVVYTDVVRMFDKITEFPSTYQEMLLLFNKIFREAPEFGALGPPMYMAMCKVMNTEGGFSAFTKEVFNRYMKKMLKTWELYLVSKDSTSVLNSSDKGWFSAAAIEAMMKYYNRTFAEVFICKPNEPAWGYTSYEDFFNRRFSEPEVDRPTGDIKDLTIVSAACESDLYAFQKDVKKTDELFIKDEAYSLVHLLANDESVDSFVGGTVIQSFLNTTGYHRWHAPVNGVIKKIVEVPGTYFAQAPSTIGDPIPGPKDNFAPPYLKSLTYFANTAARTLIFIQADNASIGLMCFVGIGMTEISSCQATVFEGQHVNRGDELGMFHFGGSSSALVFNKGANIDLTINVTNSSEDEPPHLAINAKIASAAAPPS
ncbi:phosphatidylserine decarboxylase [Moniliophthora roreri MCA 2997]|uniref:Phosphatidylserine decarboxylase n=1 Tax=Moniliophthora roreri (strain MCA 2997) TaxID=1381753 RepID=V2XE77_MONRO|nr:phosphatidylserine decarboxylase [Moniliophthora roreri MCA 2997]